MRTLRQFSVVRSRPSRRGCSAPGSGSSRWSASKSKCEDMNCRICHYELSQCLDARLPSGRRALVMQHVAECERCAQFWAELQAARELALRLPRRRPGPDFREQLFARIQTGEGTPPAVFQEHVPVIAKIRYAATGAAIAAAVLLVFTLARTGAPKAPATDDPIAATSVSATPGSATPGSATPGSANGGNANG